MKKTLFPLLLGALVAGCASNDPKMSDQNNEGALTPEVQGYLSINLVAPGGLSSRADDEPTINGDYEYGTASENYVKEVRLYFFDDEGNGVAVRKNPVYDQSSPETTGPEFFSYYDWEPTPAENELGDDYDEGGIFQDPNNSGKLENETVEKMLTVMVALTAKEAKFPTQVAAVINPTNDVKQITLNNPICDLKDLQGAVYDNLTGLTSNNFLMSSSVYVNGDGDVTITQPVDETVNLGYTQVEAQQHPIYVYVERVVARLDMSVGLTPADADKGLYSTQTQVTTEDRVYEGEDAPDGQLDEEDIYVKFLGWAVTSTPVKSYVVKSITAEWGPDEGFFGVVYQPWYIPSYHRSYWATNPVLSQQPKDEDYVWYTFNELSGVDAENPDPNTPIEQTGFTMDVDQTYMQENANPNGDAEGSDPAEPTKVIFAAQLVDVDGNAITVASWNGVYFTLQGLKNLAAKMLDMYYIEPGTGTADVPAKFVPISGNQITFMTASQFFQTNPLFSDTPNYTVYATLTSATGDDASNPTLNAAGLTWYHLNDNIDPATATADDFTQIASAGIPQYMQTVFGNAQIWNNGYTYYYYTIRHLGALNYPGYYGVVRNHIYSGTVNGLKGLGTPVWDPNEPIYPEKPDDKGTNLSAQIKVLAWRLVTDSYDFEW